MKNHILITIILVIVAGAVAFWSGIQYEKSKVTSMMGQYAQNGALGGGQGLRRFGGRNGMGATIGKIISSDANSITVQLQDGSSKIVNISDSTKLTKSDTAVKSDLANGTTVAAFGTTNSDGSITATNIQINPGMGMVRGGSSGRSASPSSIQSQ